MHQAGCQDLASLSKAEKMPASTDVVIIGRFIYLSIPHANSSTLACFNRMPFIPSFFFVPCNQNHSGSKAKPLGLGGRESAK